MNKFERTASAHLTFQADAVLIRSPITYLSHSIRDKQLIAGVVMSDLFLERAGFKRLKKYFDEKYIPTMVASIIAKYHSNCESIYLNNKYGCGSGAPADKNTLNYLINNLAK